MIDSETGHEWTWSRNRFLNRKFVMQEMYNNYIENESWELAQDKVGG